MEVVTLPGYLENHRQASSGQYNPKTNHATLPKTMLKHTAAISCKDLKKNRHQDRLTISLLTCKTDHFRMAMSIKVLLPCYRQVPDLSCGTTQLSLIFCLATESTQLQIRGCPRHNYPPAGIQQPSRRLFCWPVIHSLHITSKQTMETMAAP